MMRIIFNWSVWGCRKGMTNPKRDDRPVGRRIRQSPILMTHPPRVSMGLAWDPFTHPYIEITWISQLKALPCNQISYIWKCDLEYLGTLLFKRKFPCIKGFRSALYHNINHKPCPSRGMKKILPSSCTLEFLESLLLLT